MILGKSESNADEICEKYRKKFSGYGSKIGGYPEFVQRDPRGFQKSDSRDVKDGADEFELLLQLDGSFGWGDLGLANFFIRKADLQKRDFSKVLYNRGCF